jgi:acetylglutamate kinase
MIVVIKYGGKVVQTDMQNIAELKAMGMHPVIVHGGGNEISKLCQKMGIVPKFVNGLRVTDQATLDIAKMVLIGKVNKELVAQLGEKAVGISGCDGNLLVAKQADPALGFVGEVTQVNPGIILALIEAGYIPVIAPITQNYNINADSAASAIAVALKASHLILMTDVPGVLKDIKDPSSTIAKIKTSEIKQLGLTGGMIPKIEGAAAAIQAGVGQVHILDGRVPDCLLLHFKGQTKGTTIYAC